MYILQCTVYIYLYMYMLKGTSAGYSEQRYFGWIIRKVALCEKSNYTLHTTQWTIHTLHYTTHTTSYALHTTHYIPFGWHDYCQTDERGQRTEDRGFQADLIFIFSTIQGTKCRNLYVLSLLLSVHFKSKLHWICDICFVYEGSTLHLNRLWNVYSFLKDVQNNLI